ncbi:MAG: RNA polymerase factor sigma-54 [Planctomycetota bacterium]|jgi:RNA polymerase sigma-54 factor
MVLELRQELRLSQQLIMTPQLQMAIKLLQLNRVELVDRISQELQENPVLEEVSEIDADEKFAKEAETLSSETPQDKEVTIEEKNLDDIDWSNYYDDYEPRGRTSYQTEKREAPRYENFIARKESLNDHLLWQLLLASPTKEEEQIGSLIIGNLNRDGYLDVSVDEIAGSNGFSVDKIEQVLSLLQTFDPAGVCARDLSESLLIQVSRLGLDDTIIINIITDQIKHLESKNYTAICRALNISINDVVSAVNIIKCLEPKPGREFSDEEPQYITPDIYVYKFENEFIIVVNDDGMPKLRVNSFYRNAIKHGKHIPDHAKDYVQEKMRSAAWLIRSIHQRQKTIYRTMESILKFQLPFFEKGIANLKPMVLRDVAEDIGMHESTISRVTTNKYAHTPQGIFELKYFFNGSINRVHGEAVASASVKEQIKKIIDSENPQKPHSDDKISKILKAENIDIARRTVAKYRGVLRIVSSSKRRQF